MYFVTLEIYISKIIWSVNKFAWGNIITHISVVEIIPTCIPRNMALEHTSHLTQSNKVMNCSHLSLLLMKVAKIIDRVECI